MSGFFLCLQKRKDVHKKRELSPLLRSLNVDDPFKSSEAKGFEVVDFADDIVILVRGPKHTQSWCIKEATKKRKFNLKFFKIAGIEIQVSDDDYVDLHIYSTTKTYIRFVSVMSKNQGGYYRSKASKLQRLVCIDLTRAMFSTPFKVLDDILNLLPLHEYVLHITSIKKCSKA